jgi:hypothetical protein
MNVFVLCTGRCGSMTFTRACNHATNYTAGHETRRTYVGGQRIAYPDDHIEADNRLSWFLGRLDETYGDTAFYVHLTRNRERTARSYVTWHEKGIIRAYREGILMGCPSYIREMDVCLDYCDTVNSNIRAFLKDKTKKMEFRLEIAKDDFRQFWNRIGAEGDLDAALAEWDVSHNASGLPQEKGKEPYSATFRRRFARQMRRLTYYVKGM